MASCYSVNPGLVLFYFFFSLPPHRRLFQNHVPRPSRRHSDHEFHNHCFNHFFCSKFLCYYITIISKVQWQPITCSSILQLSPFPLSSSPHFWSISLLSYVHHPFDNRDVFLFDEKTSTAPLNDLLLSNGVKSKNLLSSMLNVLLISHDSSTANIQQ